MYYTNPIIKGFNPDPSICRVKEDYYLVTSSFEYFPGVPIYHSRNLVNWELCGHCLTRPSQLQLSGCMPSEGIYAPTLRYHNGMFYMTTTNVSHGGNFIVHTRDIRGSWSEPVWINQRGIDPSLLFADDKIYFCSNEGANGEPGIHVCEIDSISGQKITESRLISYGCGGRYPEAPHLYKVGNRYYLLLAEGGTEYGHMVTIQRSNSPYGPYETCPHNPILSHRDVTGADIECVGHADLFEDHNGNWWMVALGARMLNPEGKRVHLHNLGRESFLIPMTWSDDGWPVSGNNGRLSLEMDGPLPSPAETECKGIVETFNTGTWNGAFYHIRNPNYEEYHTGNGLVLRGGEASLSKLGASPTFIGVRQTEFDSETVIVMDIPDSTDCGEAGLSVYYTHEHHYDFILTWDNNRPSICLRRQIFDLEKTKSMPITPESKNSPIFLKLISSRRAYSFFYSLDGRKFELFGEGTTAALCTEITRTMTFTGVFIGIFARGIDAKFHSFSYQPIDEIKKLSRI